MKKYKVTFTASAVIEAEDEQQAENIAYNDFPDSIDCSNGLLHLDVPSKWIFIVEEIKK